MSTTYPAEFKPEIIQRYEKGEFLAALSQDLHIVQSTLYQWRKQYCAIQTPTHTYTPKEFDSIHRSYKNWNTKWSYPQIRLSLKHPSPT